MLLIISEYMPYDDELSFNFLTPTKVIFGLGTTKEVRMEVRALGGEKTLIVTDEGIVDADPQITWQTLSQISGDEEFVNNKFQSN